MLVMAEPIVATWSVAFARLGASTFTVKEKLALPVLSLASFAVTVYMLRAEVRARTVYTVTAKNATDNTDSASFSLTVNAPAPNLTNTTGADQIATTDSAITDITFSNSGGAIVSCTASW
jgi:hypothetical protein